MKTRDIYITISASVALIAQTLAADKKELTSVFFQMDYIYNAQFAGHVVALEKGYYEDEGLFVISSIGVSTNPTMVDRVVDIEYAIGTTHSFALLRSIEAGAPVKAVGTMFQFYPNGWIYLEDGPFKSIEDMGKVRVGLHDKSSAFDKMLVKLAGFQIDDLNVTELPEVPHDPRRVLNGDVDVMTGYLVEEYVTLDMKSGGKGEIILFNETGYEGYGQMLFTTNTMIEERPEVIRGFLKAQQKGWDDAIANPRETAELIHSAYSPDLSVDQMEQALIAMKILVQPDGPPSLKPISLERMEAARDLLLEFNMLNRTFPIDLVVDNRFNP
ncbi:MAG: ABC transporter substrate-binding protein [Verrucomicrobiota bacterium]